MFDDENLHKLICSKLDIISVQVFRFFEDFSSSNIRYEREIDLYESNNETLLNRILTTIV